MNKLTYASLFLLIFLLGAFSSRWLEATFTREEARAAARVAGLELSDAEIDSLLPNLSEFYEDYTSLREDSIDNATGPALVFDPRPADWRMPGGPDGVSVAPVAATVPTVRDSLAFYTVRELGSLLRQRKISSVELTRFFLDRLRRFDDTLHCVVSLTEVRALEQARRADAEIAAGRYRGPLHGIPYGAKDLLATRTYKTTWGATPYRDQVLDYDATVIEKLDSAGAVLVGKLTLGALAWGDVWFGGMTRNPWAPTTGSSGSSAGSAAAVAAGLVPFAIGTETLGSIVSPSTVCGTTGLRPTFGRVSRHGAMALSWSLDKIGPITRSAEDAILVLDAIRGDDGRDRHLIAAPLAYQPTQKANRKLRVGYVKAAFEGNYPFKRQDSLSLVHLRALGYELVPIELPEFPAISFILDAEAAAAFDDLTRSNRDDQLVRQIRNAWPNVFRAARFIPAVEYIQANRERTRLIQAMDELFEQVDLYVNPSWASSSLRITNYTGHPCLVIPNGFQPNGRPTSITLTGRLFDEGTIVGVGQALQDVTPWDELHPPLAR